MDKRTDCPVCGSDKSFDFYLDGGVAGKYRTHVYVCLECCTLRLAERDTKDLRQEAADEDS